MVSPRSSSRRAMCRLRHRGFLCLGRKSRPIFPPPHFPFRPLEITISHSRSYISINTNGDPPNIIAQPSRIRFDGDPRFRRRFGGDPRRQDAQPGGAERPIAIAAILTRKRAGGYGNQGSCTFRRIPMWGGGPGVRQIWCRREPP